MDTAAVPKTVKPRRCIRSKTTLLAKTCADCHQQFTFLHHLEQHKKNCLKGEVPTCKVCQRTFSTATGLHIHSRVHVSSRPYKCSICLRVYIRQGCLKQHMEEKHINVRRYECSYCTTSFARQRNLDYHIRLKHAAVKQEQKKTGFWECYLCPHKFRKQEHLDHHMSTHEAGTEVKLSCPKCGALVGSTNSLRIHMRELHPEDPSLRRHPCSVCGRIYVHRDNLCRHMETKHIQKNSPERETVKPRRCRVTLHDKTCADCNQQFEFPYQLRQHKKKCLKGEVPTCKVCQRTFATAFGLHIHSRVHVSSRPYKCSICPKEYTGQWFLNRHIQDKHTGSVRRYPCSSCETSFGRQYDLTRHIRLKHPEVKQEQKKTGLLGCHLCSRTFRKQEHLDHHKAIHGAGTEVKLSCPKCGALVGTAITLRKHLKFQHSEDPSLRRFPCTLCEKIFSHRNSLCRHVREKHASTSTQQNDTIISNDK